MSEDDLVEAYVRSGKSPDGKWWVEVPVGLSIQQANTQPISPKHIDAVCLTDQPQQVPESYPDYEGSFEYVNPDIPESGVTRTELFRRLRNSDYFNDETVSIVEAKTGKSSFKAIGQLKSYTTLLEEDFGWTVEEKILLSKQRDPIVDHAASSLDIRVVNVR
jgi:hypothetical protein